ncbi:TatD family hydrolase [Parablautia sp. Marseille-Q6255]|uniref:TatD family hydrolase n=1 Tax=Parablautia sp. Marseille-Q6255 TaxID=3039593 RepID=UPI0024BC83E9|nr:TatD family hydrolase [Parablautia sp. Marseille-Q6255]
MTEGKEQRERKEGVRMLDMHAHFCCVEKEQSMTEELQLRKEAGLRTFFSCGTPEEWEATKKFHSRREVLFSFGIHPWYADRYDAEAYVELFRACDAVGEIGMDSVWCDVPHPVQRRQLEAQLDIAARLGKPIVLHTKGQEREIAQMIRDFPNPVCVHWYSGDRQTLELFLEKDCYFTLGPDFARLCQCAQAQTQLCRYMAREIRAERLFLETDGISAVAWALGSEYTGLERISEVLWENAGYLAGIRNIKEEELCRRMEQNLREFLMLPKEKQGGSGCFRESRKRI